MKETVGSSVTFNWTIIRPFVRVEWGLAVSPSAFESPPRLLVSILQGKPDDKAAPAEYTGRVSGYITGNQVSFTLTNLRESDARLYGCRISDPNNGDDIPDFDSVKLVVQGRYSWFVVISCNPIQ